MLSTRLRRRRRQCVSGAVAGVRWRAFRKSHGKKVAATILNKHRGYRLRIQNIRVQWILRRAGFHVMHKTAISFWPQGAMHPPLLEPLRPQGVFGDLCHECTDMWRSERAKTDLGT